MSDERIAELERDLQAANARVRELEALACRPLVTKREPPERVWIHHDGYDWCVHLVERDGLRAFAATPDAAGSDGGKGGGEHE